MRDLQKDLDICNAATPGTWVYDKNDVDIWSQPDHWRVCSVGLYADMAFIAQAREGWPHAIERAIKAEAKLDRLIEGCMRCAGEDDHERFQRLRAEVERLYEINQGCESEAHLYDDLLRRCRAENAQLRKVVDAARGIFLGEGEHLCSEFEDAMDTLRQALAELDEEDTHD